MDFTMMHGSMNINKIIFYNIYDNRANSSPIPFTYLLLSLTYSHSFILLNRPNTDFSDGLLQTH